MRTKSSFSSLPSDSNSPAVLSQLSFTSVRIIFFGLCALSLVGPILLIIGVGILRAPDNYDDRVDAYNKKASTFISTQSENLLRTTARLIQRKNVAAANSNSSGSETVKMIAVEMMEAFPSRQPFPTRPSLPSGSDLIDVSVNSIPLFSNMSFTTSIDRSLWSEVIYDATSSPVFATVLNVTDSFGTTTQLPLPSLLDTKVFSVPSLFCYPSSGDKVCSERRMTELCRQQSNCANAVFNSTSIYSYMPGKGYPGCSWTRYQTTICIPVSHSKSEGYQVSSNYKSCVFPFLGDRLLSSYFASADESSTDGYFSSSSSTSDSGIYNPTVTGRDAELLALTSCSLNVSASSNFVDETETNLPIKVMIMLDQDPFMVAQNMTKGTNLFPGLPKSVEKEMGINFIIGGSAVSAFVALSWMLLKFLMQKDDDSAKNVYKAFGQVYIPSTSDYVNAIAQGRSYKYNGFVPALNQNSNKSRKSVSVDRDESKNNVITVEKMEMDDENNNRKYEAPNLDDNNNNDVDDDGNEGNRNSNNQMSNEEIMKMLRQYSQGTSAAPVPSQKISRK